MSPASLVIFIYLSIGAVLFLFADVLLCYLFINVFIKNSKIIRVSDRQAYSIPDYRLPIITILLPLYREEITFPYLLKSIIQSHYPKDKLDIRFLLESDDHHTLKALTSLSHIAGQVDGVKYNPYGFPKIIKVWDGVEVNVDYVYLHPRGARTKPNALNKGLTGAKGSIVTIFDAEDRPDPLQLRKMAVYMTKHPKVACLQARLAYYNPDQSVITKLFSIEYIQQFLLLLPSFHEMLSVILLGGTSNYFRVEVLRDLKGWDYANVTEDADLGIRLARLGYMVTPIDTITWEEAPPKIITWMKQRTRWNKGFLYTLIVHFKNPRQLIRQLGLVSATYLLYLLSSPVLFVYPIPGYILFAAFWIDWAGIPMQPLVGWLQEAVHFSGILFYVSLLTFFFGVFLVNIMAVEALFRQGDEYALKKIKYTFLSYIYVNLLQTIPATIAIFELVFKPRLWHKTPHGFSVKQHQQKKKKK